MQVIPEVACDGFHQGPMKSLWYENMDISLNFTGDKCHGCIHQCTILDLDSWAHNVPSVWNYVVAATV
jgi:hypothetical protein